MLRHGKIAVLQIFGQTDLRIVFRLKLTIFSILNSKSLFNQNVPNFYYIFSGVGAMEIVAMDMKLRGMYIARQLSFQGIVFDTYFIIYQ